MTAFDRPVTVEAFAKINWSLNILGRRADGYHQMDMLMQSVSLSDTLRFTPSDGLTLTDPDGRALDADNLVFRAAEALRPLVGHPVGAAIELNKRIPARAGLGGGSADCAAALRTLNRLWDIGLSDAELLDVGLSLGADVPFCLCGGLARVSGIGEVVQPIEAAPDCWLALVTPGGGLSTPAVFKAFDRSGDPGCPADLDALTGALLRGDLSKAAGHTGNALEPSAIAMLPEIRAAMEAFCRLGAAVVRMSGSGSTVFGAFADEASARHAAEAIPGAAVARTLSVGCRVLP